MVVVRTQQGWYDRTGSIQYPDIKSVLPRKYVKAINNITAPTELLSAKGVINRNSMHTGPERDRLIPIKLQLGPGVEIIGGVTPPPPSFAPLNVFSLAVFCRNREWRSKSFKSKLTKPNWKSLQNVQKKHL